MFTKVSSDLLTTERAFRMEWPWGWHSTKESTAAGAEAIQSEWVQELQREVPLNHVLYGLSVKLIAHRHDCDDALFALEDGRVAQVHLTWRFAREIDPQWPETIVYQSLEEWIVKSS